MCKGEGPTAAGEDPSVWGRGEKGRVVVVLQREGGGVDREKEAGTKRGMNVARLAM